MSEARRHDAIALGILTLLVGLLFADVLFGINSLYLRDISHYYEPAKHVLREIVRGGEFPYWNPWFSAGQPMAANPEHEVFYPLTWLILLPSYDFGFRLLIVLHVAVAAWTMYALLRSMELEVPASTLGALSFALGGIVLSNLAYLPILFSLAWLPLTCLYTRRFLRGGARRDLALAALFLGVQLVVGEPTTALQSGILLGMYALWSGWRRGGARKAALALVAVGAISIGALLVSTVQTLPAIDHAADSVRGRGFDFSTVRNWSMPFARAVEWIFPNALGHQQIDGKTLYWAGRLYSDRASPFFVSIYPGLLLVILAIAGIAARYRGAGLVATIAIVSVVAAAGGNTPLLRFLYDLGVWRSFRYPEKFILFGTFALTVFGAMMLDRLLRGDARIRRAMHVVLLVLTALAATAAILALTPANAPLFHRFWGPQPPERLPQMLALWRSGWILAAARGLLLLILARNLGTLRRGWTTVLLGAFVLLDLTLLLPDLAPRVPPSFYRDVPPAAQVLPSDRDAYRIYHKAAWEPVPAEYQQTLAGQRDRYWLRHNALIPMIPARYGIRTVIEIDYDLTALVPTADFVQSIWELGSLRPDWADVGASMSNAWYGTAWAPANDEIARANGDARRIRPIRLIELPHYPRYSFADRVETIRDRDDFVAKLGSGRFGKRTAFVTGSSFVPASGTVRRVSETMNGARLEVETGGPAFLVMSVTPHKYWTLTIDGVERPAVVTNVGYQGVVVPGAGRHVVEMRYRNPLIAAGAAVTALALAAILYVVLRDRRRRGTSTLTMRAL